MKNIFPLFCLLILFGCDSEKILTSDTIKVNELTKEWVHSREEEVDSVQIYRPAGFKHFPSSRYRQKYIFKNDGVCRYYVLHPGDAHYFTDGIWTYNENDRRLVIYDSSKVIESEFKVISLTRFMLKFVKVK